ncbi:sigma-70 family RNA polymerase sigma factor [Sporosarcina aquimarina]|uniref:Sigma-70 family RNA polymerase sigma factor n=1 Tax=Sporosarcina aquimarina TaxID=114975 RepID=A0ABU4G4D9_9BACL|nr:sigma-70 family RNA polymerase sigma factor [Sporosarcina aquimarina]MDW0111220.1 sigma-70 family RNA polymerase sigma factor [Sporosarcina aquimarina]
MDSYSIDQTKLLPYETIVDELMNDYGQDVLQLVMQYVHNLAVAEDLTQEIFVKCYRALPTFQFNSSIKMWLWRIAINHTKDYLKSWYAKNVQAMETDRFEQVKSGECVEQQVIQQQEEDELARAVFALPVKYREVIYLCYYEEQSMKEMADVLQLNESTMKTRLRKARQLLEKRLERE